MLAIQALAEVATASGRDAKEEAAIEGQLAASDASVVPAFRAATAAFDAERLDDAKAGFQKVLKRVPRHAPSLRRLAGVHSRQKQHAQAITLARQAVAADGSAESRLTLAMILAMTEDPAVKAESRTLAAAAYRDSPGERGATLLAQLAITDGDQTALAAAVDNLRRHAPEAAATHYYGALLSLLRNEGAEADRLLDRAVAAGFPAEAAAQLREQTGLGKQLRFWLYVKIGIAAFVAWLAGLAGLYLFGRLLSARTLAAIEQAAGDADSLKRKTAGLRGIYNRTIAMAAAYYYLSIPFVIALVLLGGAGVILGFLLIGWLPFYLVATVIIGTLFTVWTVLRSLLASRGPEEEPGRKLTEAEAPALWSLLREVAAQVGTRPVDTVYLTPGTDMGVAETGPLRARLADRGHRFLVLGIGGLAGFSLPAFRAVLAHEYGHFSHRDTAGGDRARAVLGAFLRTVTALATRGGMLILNPAWHFLRVYHAMFMRITLGASRLQEVMADHFAAVAYGPCSFAAGLGHVVRRSVEFARESDLLVERAEKQRKPVASLYRLPPDAELSVDDTARAVAEAMAAKGSPYDSHPPPQQRIAWVSRMPGAEPELSGEIDAWSLFESRAALEAEMTSLVNDRLERAGVIDEPAKAPFEVPATGGA